MDESYGNPDYQGGHTNTSDPQDNSFRNIDRLPLGKVLQISKRPRTRKVHKLRKKMPDATRKGK